MALTTSTNPIAELAAKLEKDHDLAKLLKESLQLAKASAQAGLDPVLFDALSWPVEIPDTNLCLKV